MPTYGQLVLMGIGLVGYVAAAAVAIRRFRRPERVTPVGLAAPLLLGLVAGAGLVIWRVTAAGTLLAVSGFDAMILIAWLMAAEVLAVRWAGRLNGVDAFFLPMAAALQAGSLLMIRSGASGAHYLHAWHIVGHAMVILVAGACFVASGLAGLAYLFVHRAMRSRRQLSVLGRLPPLESLERFGRRMVAAGFPLLTFGILTGVCAIAHTPPEDREREMMMASGTLALWVVYGIAMLIVWVRPRFRGHRAAMLATGAAGLTVVNFLTYLLMRSHV